MKDIMYQEIDIKLNVTFLQRQLRTNSSYLDTEIKGFLRVEFDEYFVPEPMAVTEVKSSMTNAHIRLTTSVDARKTDKEIRQYIIRKVIDRFRWGIADIEVMFMREEAEIYGNV